MGKVKKAVMSVDPETGETVADSKRAQKNSKDPKTRSAGKKSMVIWEELYTDLATGVAFALREARVKPDQLTAMSDGEITAIEGIGETGLEEIRVKYPAFLAEASSEGSEPATPVEVVVEKVGPRPANKRHLFKNGKAIRAAKSKVDRTKTYSIEDAVKLVKATNITKFDATITVHINLIGKEAPTRVELTFPHMAGTAKKIAIVNDALLKDIEAGKFDFDILLTTPAFMPKLAKFARVLGPKGLMPSPKAGTVTTDPEGKSKEFAAGKTVLKAEAKFPLMHITVGKAGQPEAELAANIKALIDAVRTKNIGKAVLAATMSPGIKLQLA